MYEWRRLEEIIFSLNAVELFFLNCPEIYSLGHTGQSPHIFRSHHHRGYVWQITKERMKRTCQVNCSASRVLCPSALLIWPNQFRISSSRLSPISLTLLRSAILHRRLGALIELIGNFLMLLNCSSPLSRTKTRFSSTSPIISCLINIFIILIFFWSQVTMVVVVHVYFHRGALIKPMTTTMIFIITNMENINWKIMDQNIVGVSSGCCVIVCVICCRPSSRVQSCFVGCISSTRFVLNKWVSTGRVKNLSSVRGFLRLESDFNKVRTSTNRWLF